MKLSEIGMLIISSPRSSAYLQSLLSKDFLPSHIIIMEDSAESLSPGQLSSGDLKEQKLRNNAISKIDLNIPITEIIKSHSLSYEVCKTIDVNSKELIDIIKNRPEKYFIFSGSGGMILKQDILNCGKLFLHVHSGSLPNYRGSTTIYYSIINDSKCFATALFLNEKIDSGDMILTKEYEVPNKETNIDYYYDSIIRADLLLDVIDEYVKIGKIAFEAQESISGETYFIIHPILKHIALLSLK